MRRWIVLSVGLTAIILIGATLFLAGRANFVPDFLEVTGMKYVGTNNDLDVPIHCYTSKVAF